jgi:organic hydroperoxide reductase OsmC/OhrA
MLEHLAHIRWQRESEDFTYEGYNRSHRWEFAPGIEVPASSAPDFLGDADRVDPEQVAKLHHQAHEHCFIANSVKTSVEVAPE